MQLLLEVYLSPKNIPLHPTFFSVWNSPYDPCSNSLRRVLYALDDNTFDKKVLLRERKRHTSRRVACARHAALSPNGGGGRGVPHPVWDGKGDTPSSPRKGGTPILSWIGVPLSGPGMGVSPFGPGMGYPPL